MTFSPFLIITLKVFLTRGILSREDKSTGMTNKGMWDMANQSASVWKKDPKVEGCNAEPMTHVLVTASASLLMYFRVRKIYKKSTKLEFGFSSWSHFARMPTEFLFQLGGLSAKRPRTSGAVI